MPGPSTNGMLGLDITAFEESWKRMLAQMDTLPSKTAKASSAITKLKGAFSALGVSLGVSALISFGRSVLSFGREISDASKEAGVLPEQLQRIQAALSKDLGADDAAAALKKLNGLMREARNGSAEAESKLAQLGVSFTDLKKKSPDEVLRQIADRVRDSKDPIETLRQVSNAFGDDLATKLIPALQQGGDSIKKLGDDSSVASNQMVESAARGQRAFERLSNYIKQSTLEAADYWSRFKINWSGLKTDGSIIGGMGVRGAGGTVPKTAHTLEVERRNLAKGDNKSDANSSQRTAEQNSLDSLRQIAEKYAPEYDKQLEKLNVEYELLAQKLTVARDLEADKIKLQMAQNEEAKRALRSADMLRDSEIQLNETKARGVSYDVQQAEITAKIQDLDRQISIAVFQGDRQKIASLQAQRREVNIGSMELRVAHDEQMTALRLETQQREAQIKGMKGVAEQAAIVAEFDAEIARQIRAGNKEAADMLARQKEIALVQQRAAEHQVTARDRRIERRDARVTQRRARQQEARENSLRRAGARGERGRAITEQMLKDRNANEGRLRIEQAKQDAANFKEDMKMLFANVGSIAKDVSQ